MSAGGLCVLIYDLWQYFDPVTANGTTASHLVVEDFQVLACHVCGRRYAHPIHAPDYGVWICLDDHRRIKGTIFPGPPCHKQKCFPI